MIIRLLRVVPNNRALLFKCPTTSFPIANSALHQNNVVLLKCMLVNVFNETLRFRFKWNVVFYISIISSDSTKRINLSLKNCNNSVHTVKHSVRSYLTTCSLTSSFSSFLIHSTNFSFFPSFCSCSYSCQYPSYGHQIKEWYI